LPGLRVRRAFNRTGRGRRRRRLQDSSEKPKNGYYVLLF
jgi:hypothetical protein